MLGGRNPSIFIGPSQAMKARHLIAMAVLVAACPMLPLTTMAQTASAPLVLETKVPLGEVSGRIDHLGIDLKRQRLFIAELGNDSLGVIDLAAGKLLQTISGMRASRRGSPIYRLQTVSMSPMAVMARYGYCAARISR